MTMIADSQDILKFWFEECDPGQHFNGGESFDREIWNRFRDTIEVAKRCELWTWRQTVQGRLAEIIVLDQFSRNVYRGDPRAYSSDDMACVLAQELIQHEDFNQLSNEEKHFALMPFMHSESLTVHEKLAVPCFEKLNDPEIMDYERRHKEQIQQFGRYPFRNEALGRESTSEEEDFMETEVNF